MKHSPTAPENLQSSPDMLSDRRKQESFSLGDQNRLPRKGSLRRSLQDELGLHRHPWALGEEAKARGSESTEQSELQGCEMLTCHEEE